MKFDVSRAAKGIRSRAGRMRRAGRPGHAPINPLTGLPADVDPCTGGPVRSGAGEPFSSVGVGSPAAPAGSAPEAPLHPDPAAAPETRAGGLLDRGRRLVDRRVFALALLALLDFYLVGVCGLFSGNLLAFIAVLLGGAFALDRSVAVRRCIVLGGSVWLAFIVLGRFMCDATADALFYGVDYMFMFAGLVAAVGACGAYALGRRLYARGREQGAREADREIARTMVERLIERPDDWGAPDGGYLEVESALARVRAKQRAAEQALRDEARRKDDLVTYLAHDLKTPLASVVGYLSLLGEAPDLPPEQRARFTGIALDKAHRLDALIEEFFDITRFDFHDIVLTRGYVDLGLMLAQVADEFYPTLSEQGKRVDLDVPQGLVVLIDGDKMARVFNNVLKNAIAYSYEGSTIRISAEQVPGPGPCPDAGPGSGRTPSDEGDPKAAAPATVVRIENEGDPIPAPKLELIFEKFYRLDAARATNRGGAGLGLAIAKEIVVAHGGAISCASTPERTVFTIELPAG